MHISSKNFYEFTQQTPTYIKSTHKELTAALETT